MPKCFLRTQSALLVTLLAACASTDITLESVAGIYGCDPCLLAGSTLILRSDGTYTNCMFSDTPEFNGKVSKESHGSYSLDGKRVELSENLSEHSIDVYVIRVRGKLYLITEELYLDYGDNNAVIEDLGLKQRSLALDSPYVCAE